jgi:hypothetical protein
MIAAIDYKQLSVMPYYECTLNTYFFELTKEQFNSLEYIKNELSNKNYIDISNNHMYLFFIASDWFNSLNLNNKRDVYAYIDKLNFIIENYNSEYYINRLKMIIADCYLHLDDKPKWIEMHNQLKSKFPDGGPVEASRYLNIHRIMNIDLDPFDLARCVKYKINKKLCNYDLSIFSQNISNIIYQNNIDPIQEIYEARIAEFKKLNIELKPRYVQYFLPNLFIFNNFNKNEVKDSNYNHRIQEIEHDYFLSDDHELFFRYRRMIREAENLFRKEIGLKPVGQAWISETTLFNQLKEHFVHLEIIQHGNPKFLNKQHFDIWFPEQKIAVEYHGLQHFKPVEFFGGEEAFVKNQARDKNKLKLAEENGVHLIVVTENYDLKEIINEIEIKIRPIK